MSLHWVGYVPDDGDLSGDALLTAESLTLGANFAYAVWVRVETERARRPACTSSI